MNKVTVGALTIYLELKHTRPKLFVQSHLTCVRRWLRARSCGHVWAKGAITGGSADRSPLLRQLQLPDAVTFVYSLQQLWVANAPNRFKHLLIAVQLQTNEISPRLVH